MSMFALTMLEPVCMTYLFDQLVYWIVFFFLGFMYMYMYTRECNM